MTLAPYSTGGTPLATVIPPMAVAGIRLMSTRLSQGMLRSAPSKNTATWRSPALRRYTSVSPRELVWMWAAGMRRLKSAATAASCSRRSVMESRFSVYTVIGASPADAVITMSPRRVGLIESCCGGGRESWAPAASVTDTTRNSGTARTTRRRARPRTDAPLGTSLHHRRTLECRRPRHSV